MNDHLFFLQATWNMEMSLMEKIVYPLAIVFCIIPPSLPMAMLFGIVWANIRLRRTHSIFCTNPKNIITCGSINCVCFDKVHILHLFYSYRQLINKYCFIQYSLILFRLELWQRTASTCWEFSLLINRCVAILYCSMYIYLSSLNTNTYKKISGLENYLRRVRSLRN